MVLVDTSRRIGYILHVARKAISTIKTADREKYALWLDNGALKKLREYQLEVGVPVSESIRRAINAYLEGLKKRK